MWMLILSVLLILLALVIITWAILDAISETRHFLKHQNTIIHKLLTELQQNHPSHPNDWK